MLKNELAAQFKAKWDWAQNRFGFVHVTDAEQKELIEALERFTRRENKLKQLLKEAREK